MKKQRKKTRIFFAFLFCACLVVLTTVSIKAQEIKTDQAGLTTRVAPGELLPVSVKLMNFGNNKEIDVTVDYKVLNGAGNTVATVSDTVAVRTTASFVKNIQIPHDLPPGKYTAVSHIQYQGQEVPATSRFEFDVEKKIAGIFMSKFILYSGITIFVGLLFVIISRLIIRHKQSRIKPFEYKHIPKGERMYYEMVSDMLMQMRTHAGDKALELARDIDGLEVDETTGEIKRIDRDPGEAVALLMLNYEKRFGEKLDLGKFKKNKKESGSSIDKNIEMIQKYFS